MSSYYHYNAHQHPTAANGPSAPASQRGRRPLRLPQNSNHNNGSGSSSSNMTHRQTFRNQRKEEEAAVLMTFRQRFELQRSFDLDDDLEFCPTLLTDVDMVSIHSSSSDRSSLTSGSPTSSPQSHTVAPEANFSLNSNSAPYIPAAYQTHTTPLKLHQPSATRVRSAIPIVNPTTGLSMSSPPRSISPTRMQMSSQRW